MLQLINYTITHFNMFPFLSVHPRPQFCFTTCRLVLLHHKTQWRARNVLSSSWATRCSCKFVSTQMSQASVLFPPPTPTSCTCFPSHSPCVNATGLSPFSPDLDLSLSQTFRPSCLELAGAAPTPLPFVLWFLHHAWTLPSLLPLTWSQVFTHVSVGASHSFVLMPWSSPLTMEPLPEVKAPALSALCFLCSLGVLSVLGFDFVTEQLQRTKHSVFVYSSCPDAQLSASSSAHLINTHLV